MAVKSNHGRTVKTLDSGSHLYSLMEDGIILSQWRYQGRLEGAKILTRKFKGQAAQVSDRLVLVNGVLKVRKETRTLDHERAIGPCPCGRNIAQLQPGVDRCSVDNDVAESYLAQYARANRRIREMRAH